MVDPVPDCTTETPTGSARCRLHDDDESGYEKLEKNVLDNVEASDGNDERGNNDDERLGDNDENEGWNFDLMSATAYGGDQKS